MRDLDVLEPNGNLPKLSKGKSLSYNPHVRSSIYFQDDCTRQHTDGEFRSEQMPSIQNREIISFQNMSMSDIP